MGVALLNSIIANWSIDQSFPTTAHAVIVVTSLDLVVLIASSAHSGAPCVGAMIDAYDVLGVQLDCKEEDVKKAHLGDCG